MSAYYYTGAVGIFVGVIFALSLFLLSYRGYKKVCIDRVVGGVGGLAAIGVVLFPTDPPHGLDPLLWWTKATGHLHYASAIVLFLCFFVFAVWLFRKSSVPKGMKRPLEKRIRDTICLICGGAIAIGIGWAAVSLLTSEGSEVSIFYQETLAIEAFAISWLAKGAVHEPVVKFVRRRILRTAAPNSDTSSRTM